MKCSIPGINEKLVQYMENLLPPGEMEEVARHLRTCEACREEEESLRETTGLLKLGRDRGASAHAPCPDEEMLLTFAEAPAALRDGDRRMVARHVKKCADCARALSLLGELDRELEKSPQSKPVTAAMPEALKREARRLYGREKESLWQKCLQLFQIRPRYSLLSALAATLLIVGVFTILFNDMTALRQEKAGPPAFNEGRDLSFSTTTKADNPGRLQPAAIENKKGTGAREEAMTKDPVAQAPAALPGRADFKRERESTSGIIPSSAQDERAGAQAGGLSRKPGIPEGKAYAPSTSKKSHFRAGEAPSMPSLGASADKLKERSCNQTIDASDRRKNENGSESAGSAAAERTPADGERMAACKTQAACMAPARLEAEKKQLEQQMKAKAETLVNSALGRDRATIEVTIVPCTAQGSLTARRVEVMVRSSAPLKDEDREKLRGALMAGLKLDARRDSLIITEKAYAQ